VVEDGMVGRSNTLRRETWAEIRTVFIVPDKDTKSRRSGVRTPIVARKPGNAGGAKGCREMDAR
jgi:hypothetical protein